MAAALAAGEDLHAATARQLLGKRTVTPEEREVGKTLNYAVVYGLDAAGVRRQVLVRTGVELMEAQVNSFFTGLFERFAAVAAWQARVRRERRGESRTLTGRRLLIPEDARDSVRLNVPVAGTAADGVKRALALLLERRDQVPGACPILVCRDEILVECEAGQATAVAAWLRRAMVDGRSPLLRPVPVVVDMGTGQTWAEAADERETT
jgi:DNA polymerase I-like protein with 3'-5' exonuclease and polymerase domains